jgi:transposase
MKKRINKSSATATGSATATAPLFQASAAYLGIDVSKEHFDAALCLSHERIRQDTVCQRFTNDAKGIRAFDKWITTQGVGIALRPALVVVMENTGIYHRRLWQYCCDHNLHATIGNAADIKWSFGLVRGKNDLTDSIRLCDYAYRHADRLRQVDPFDEDVLLLKDLYAARRRLIRQLQALQVALGELKDTNKKAAQSALEKINKPAIEGLSKALKLVEAEIKALIKGNERMNNNYRLVMSVPGIGHVTAVYLICPTANFIGKPTGKQLACYAGVAPFENTSGSSIKGKGHVNRMANKELKRLLHMGARSVSTHNKEARTYYERKAAEGKHDLVIINAVKNKMLLRVAAVVREGRAYVDKSRIAA